MARLLTTILVLGAAVPGAAASGAVDHPSVQDVLVMVDAGLEEIVILARVDAIGAFPVLDGHDLAELKRCGVPDRVLLRMIELGAPPHTPPPTAEPEALVPTPAPPIPGDGGGAIRVFIERPFRVTYFEVALNGELVHTDGTLYEGSVGAGHNLTRPQAVGESERFLAFEGPLAAGATGTAVGFAVSMVESDPGDGWGEYAGEHYLTRGVRAVGEKIQGQHEGGNPGVVCEVAAGQTCEVTATFERTTPTRLGGLPIYSVRYRTRVIEVEKVPGEPPLRTPAESLEILGGIDR